MKKTNFISFLDNYFEKGIEENWDNCGLQNEIFDEEITNVFFTLSLNSKTIDQAIENNANFIISHHPVFIDFENKDDLFVNSILKKLLDNKISVYSAHTNFDSMRYGLNYLLLKELDIEPSGYLYEKTGMVAYVDNMSLDSLANKIRNKFNIDVKVYQFNKNKSLNKIAFCSGSASSYYQEAIKKGCDVFITGDITYHKLYECEELEFNLIDINHNIEAFCVNEFQKAWDLFKKEINENSK